MLRQRQNRLPKQFGDFGAFQAIEGCVPIPIRCGVFTVSIRAPRIATPLWSASISRFLDQRDIPALFYMQFPDVIACDAINKRSRSSLFFVVLRGTANQRQERFLDDIGRRLRTSHHMNGVPEKTALMTPIELQKRVFIPG
jgi:hypothetical protein